jgi:hypothetical protein
LRRQLGHTPRKPLDWLARRPLLKIKNAFASTETTFESETECRRWPRRFLSITALLSSNRIVLVNAVPSIDLPKPAAPAFLAGGRHRANPVYLDEQAFPSASVQILERVPFASPLPILGMLATVVRMREMTLITLIRT